MTVSPELKSALEESNKTITAIQDTVKEMKGRMDGLDAEKISKMEADLASALSAKSAAENEAKGMAERVEALEVASNRPGAAGKSAESTETKEAFIELLRKGDEAGLRDLSQKAVSSADLGSGAYAIPKEISAIIEKVAAERSPMRQLVRVVQTGADYAELLDLGGAKGRWVGEDADRTGTTATPKVERIVPIFGEMNARPEATRHSMQDIFFNVEAWLIDAVATEFAAMEGAAILNGDGVDKPRGLLTAAQSTAKDATRAFGTFQHFLSGAADGVGGYDPIHDLVFGTKSAYRANGKFLLNSLTLAGYAKVTDNEGRYLLQASVADSVGDKLAGYGTVICEDMPDVAGDATPVAFGDFQKGYVLADRPSISMIRDEITKPGFVAFNAFKRVGGNTKDSNAIKFLKIAV